MRAEWLQHEQRYIISEYVTMAKPTSAFFRAGPSLVPSPVTATTCLCSSTVLSMMPGCIQHMQLVHVLVWGKQNIYTCVKVQNALRVFVAPSRTFDQGVFVRGRGACQHPQLGPDLINTLLFNLSMAECSRNTLATPRLSLDITSVCECIWGVFSGP